MGTGPLKTMQQAKVVPKNRGIQSLRTQPFLLPSGAHVLFTYSAAMQDVDYSRYVDMLTDCRIAMRKVATGEFTVPKGKYHWVKDFSDTIKQIEAQYTLTGKPVPIAMDTETKGLDRFAPDGYIVSLQVTVKAGTGDAVYFNSRDNCLSISKKLKKQIEWMMTTPKVMLRGANFKYDVNWIRTMWDTAPCTNFRFDTMLVGSLLDENRSNSLNVHAKVYTPMGGYDDAFNSKYDKSRMDLVPKDDLLDYGVGDTDACFQSAEKMRTDLLADNHLANFYVKVLHPAARAYEDVEQVGWCIDRDYYEYLKDELLLDIREQAKLGKEIIGGRLVAKHTKKDGTLNLTKPSLLKDYFFSPIGLNLRPKQFTPKSGEPAVGIDHLKLFANHPEAGPMVKMLEEYGSAKRTKSHYIDNFLRAIRSDGRLHPVFFLFAGEQFGHDGGAVTGRISVIDPAIQTIPKHTNWAKRLRKAFHAPPGYLIGADDYSQGELKIAACLANEEVMIAAYLEGVDLHAKTAAELSGMTLEEFMLIKEEDEHKFEEIRYLGKAGGFGLLYGMGVEGFMEYALNNYGLEMSYEQAQEYRERFFALYPGLQPWHRRYKAIAHDLKYMRSPLGRVRHLPLIDSSDQGVMSKAERQAVNSPVQGTLSDMSLWATALMKKQGMLVKAPVFGMIHDQLLRYVPEDNYEKVLREGKDVMENLPFEKLGWQPQLRFTVDCEVGPTLGDLKKLKIAA